MSYSRTWLPCIFQKINPMYSEVQSLTDFSRRTYFVTCYMNNDYSFSHVMKPGWLVNILQICVDFTKLMMPSLPGTKHGYEFPFWTWCSNYLQFSTACSTTSIPRIEKHQLIVVTLRGNHLTLVLKVWQLEFLPCCFRNWNSGCDLGVFLGFTHRYFRDVTTKFNRRGQHIRKQFPPWKYENR